MKKLTQVKTVVSGDSVTITGKIVDTLPHEFKFPIQQVSIGYLNPDNIRHPRHVQISGEAVFVKGRGNAFVITHDDLVSIAAQVEPLTSYQPWFNKMPSADKLTVEFSSELEPSLQWKWSDGPAPDGKWTNIEGATTATLTKTDALKDKWVSCVASSNAGATSTPPIKL